MIPTNGFGDFQVSLALASGICAALYAREKSGMGDKITISLHHAAVYALSEESFPPSTATSIPKTGKKFQIHLTTCSAQKTGNGWCCAVRSMTGITKKIMTLLGRKGPDRK